ncbi:hypothetical protein B0A49_10517 [Cryomyces minteri]|uniref:Uncharacterized protein n=1 Tax=Cryomyces minteri TaxID=331657 RepID=A0A4U0WN77_9PEZI|nr:hypothetical protein B0A49_10517 [Cryomyces minteri]
MVANVKAGASFRFLLRPLKMVYYLSISTASAALYEEESRLQQTAAEPHQARDQSPLQPYLFAPDQREAVPEKVFSKQALLNAHSTPDDVVSPLVQLHDALEVMQSRFFELWLGTWPDAIDWTAAVMGTYVSAALSTLAKSADHVLKRSTDEETASAKAQSIENEMNKYFSQSVAYYFGENAFSIRTQAYDDMLWVVLGWLESIKLIDLHTDFHRRSSGSASSSKSVPWYGKQFKASFAHRAHIFYEIASHGWDTSMCGGGMTWNPHLRPYKNAITNQLFISASMGMYLYFPGDENNSPFLSNDEDDAYQQVLRPARPHNPRYLNAAVDGYAWLKNSNMTNDQGLYVDGFHILGWGRNGTKGTRKCDLRNEMVYTYNQGVLLSGLRQLWEGTGDTAYLKDGHELVRNVIKATGWRTLDRSPPSEAENGGTHKRWAGLGRGGILEELCDATGTCSQDSQTFKGIFFHHLTLFCEPLPDKPIAPGKTYSAGPAEKMLHGRSCREYTPWVTHNARAAMETRDEDGVFGMWWGHGPGRNEESDVKHGTIPEGAVDYRNNSTLPLDGMWLLPELCANCNGYTTAGHNHFAGPTRKQDRSGSARLSTARMGRLTDPFASLPIELLYHTLSDLTSPPIAAPRFVSRTLLQQLPHCLFRRLVLDELPCPVVEAPDLPVVETDWFRLYCEMKWNWLSSRGLKELNPGRIGEIVKGIVERIAAREGGEEVGLARVD